MVIYEVRLKPDAEILEAFRIWLFDHVRAMVALPGFIDARIMTPEVAGAQEVVVHYRLKNHDALQRYMLENAERMRALGTSRFPNGFKVERRIYFMDEVIKPISKPVIEPDC